MDSTYIIAALALFTIGATLAGAIFHFGVFLKGPENIDAAKRVAADRESATTRVTEEGVNGRTLRQRLDAAPGINTSLSPRDTRPLDTVMMFRWSDVRNRLNGPR